MAKYRCTVCGYIYDPARGDPGKSEPGTRFEDLPEDWVCPVCGADKSKFEPVSDQVVIRRYSNGEITVMWQPARCNHNGNCWRSLPEVFEPKKRPWVNIYGSHSATVARVVDECPTKALTWEKARPGDQVRPR